MAVRKRQRGVEGQQEAPAQQEQHAAAAGAAAAAGGGEAGPSQAPLTDNAVAAGARKQQMHDIARRRAAHFAHYQDEGEQDDGPANVHAGGTEARTLGPFSSAVQLVNEREAAAQKRQAQVQQAAFSSSGAKAQLVQWQPSRDPSLGPRHTASLPSLTALCTQVLVEYVDCIESLTGVPDEMRTRLATAVCVRRKLSPEAAMVFVGSQPAEVVLPDCAQLDRAAMVQLMRLAASSRLERLELGMCGKGFGDNFLKRAALTGSAAAAALPEEPVDTLVAAAAQLPGSCLQALHTLRLAGPYRLNDQGLLAVLKLTPGLQSLAVPDASRLTGALLQPLPTTTPLLRHLDLTNCRGLDGPAMAANLPQLTHLHSLILDGLTEVDDAVLLALVGSAGQPASALTHLSLALCASVTDSGVRCLAARAPGLRGLRLDQCSKVTDAGVAALAAGCRQLQELSLMRVPKVTDLSLVQVVGNGRLAALTLHGAQGVTDMTMLALTQHCHHTLTSLDVSFCRQITSNCLGLLADRCQALQSLVVFGCSQVTARFASGHSNARLLEGAGVVGLGTVAVTAAA